MKKNHFAINVLALGLIAALSVIVWQSPERGETFISILGILVSWPVVIGVLGIGLGVFFKRELSSFIDRLATVNLKLPGGAEFSSSIQPAPEPKEEKKEKGATGLTPTEQKVVDDYINELQQKVSGSEKEKQELISRYTSLLDEKQRQVTYWWFEYLSFYLVPVTQNILRWFAGLLLPTTLNIYHEMWKGIVPDTQQREAVLEALLYHRLIRKDGALVQVTEAGRQFLSHMDMKYGLKKAA